MARGSCVACGSEGSSTSCERCQNVTYCSPQCHSAHWPLHKLVCGLAARGEKPAAAEVEEKPLAPLRFSAKDVADATRSLLRDSSAIPAAAKGSSAAEQERILSELAAAAAARGEAPAASLATKGTSLQLATGLRELQAACVKAEAEEAWSSQAAASEAAKLPRLHALFACEVDSLQRYEQLVALVQSICKQWRAPPEHSLVSWHSDSEELQGKVRALMKEFTQAIEGGGARIAYADGPARAVRCRVTSVEQPSALALGEHIRRLVDLVPDAETSWVMVSESDGFWHPGRTAFFRNFSRQVPGPDKCVATVAPVLVRPTSAEALAGGSFAGPLEVNRMLQQGHPGAVVLEELSEVSQYCMRRSVLAAFFEAHKETVIAHELVLTRMLSFVARENGSKCLQVAPEQFRAPDKNAAAMWMIFCRRPSPMPLSVARASDVDSALARAAPAAHRERLGVEELSACIAKLRREVEYHVLRQWGNKGNREVAELALESVDLGFEADEETRQGWLVPLSEELASGAARAFGAPCDEAN